MLQPKDLIPYLEKGDRTMEMLKVEDDKNSFDQNEWIRSTERARWEMQMNSANQQSGIANGMGSGPTGLSSIFKVFYGG